MEFLQKLTFFFQLWTLRLQVFIYLDMFGNIAAPTPQSCTESHEHLCDEGVSVCSLMDPSVTPRFLSVCLLVKLHQFSFKCSCPACFIRTLWDLLFVKRYPSMHFTSSSSDGGEFEPNSELWSSPSFSCVSTRTADVSVLRLLGLWKLWLCEYLPWCVQKCGNLQRPCSAEPSELCKTFANLSEMQLWCLNWTLDRRSTPTGWTLVSEKIHILFLPR